MSFILFVIPKCMVSDQAYLVEVLLIFKFIIKTILLCTQLFLDAFDYNLSGFLIKSKLMSLIFCVDKIGIFSKHTESHFQLRKNIF